ncbi:MAG: hypothetical protein CVU00_11415 [Bacteroidetes bacterium HGW-Bacteroidetes-17]|jgi:hypothetical protein|nr:MAG: hypothetical protein CVU00_11415 [Bacteroidetes bacterium HGW-Bacteroidetes-17]
MKKIIITTIIILIHFLGLAQDSNCNCNTVFDDLIQKLETNYIGFAQMENPEKITAYNQRKKEFKDIVSKTQGENCTALLQKFLSYFKDGHLFVYEQPKYSEKELAKFKLEIKENKVNTNALMNTLDLEKNWIEKSRLDGIIGTWTDGQSEFVIIKDEGYYKAYVLNSKLESIDSGELKAQFKATEIGFEGMFYSDNYTPRFAEGNMYKEGALLVFTGANYWGKLEPENKREIAMLNKQEVNLPTIQKLDDENTLFSIPSFLVDSEKFFKVLMDNIDLLKNTKNLIFDIRANVGGNAIYMSFLESYATRPLESSQGLVLASEETKQYFERLAKNSPEVYEPVVKAIETNMGKIVDGPKYPEKIFPPSEFNINNVAILMDEGCMSAAESFILHSKSASSKVTTFGTNTAGVIDYTSVNTINLKSGNQNIYFGYPTSTYHKNIPENGYNNGGITPDVPIKSKVEDKVQYIINYYKQRN